MADFATNLNIEGRLRLLPTDSGNPARSSVEPQELLELLRALSDARSDREIWDVAGKFLGARLGRCTLRRIDSLSDASGLSIDVVEQAADGCSPIVSKLPNACQIVTPVEHGDADLGWVIIEIARSTEMTGAELDLIQLVVYSAAADCARLQCGRGAEQHENDLSFIHRIEQQISDAPDVSSIGIMVQEELSYAVQNTLFAMLVVHEDPAVLEVVAYKRDDGDDNLGFLVPIEGSKAGMVFKSGEPMLVDNVLEDDGAYGRADATWRSLLIAPLLSGTEIYGVVMVGHKEPSLYSERDLHIVELTAHHIGNAIYRMLDDERAQAQNRAVIETLAAAVDLRDPFTHTHSIRVAELGRRLALHLGYSERDAEQLELAGLLHDIGKIGVPDRVLSKPGALDPEERLIIMSHAELGAKIVDQSPLLSSLTPMVRHHHEWYDGRGYPDGLRGSEIPLGAAILGVVDALETMTSNRVYRRALTLEQAKQELLAGRGSQFHPEAATAMLELLDHDPEVQQLVKDAPDQQKVTSALQPMNISDVANLRVMQRVAAEIGTLTEIDSFLEHVHLIVRDELELADIVIWLLDETRDRFELAAGLTELPAPGELEPASVRIEGHFVHSDGVAMFGRCGSDVASDDTVLFPMYVEDSLIGLIELVLLKPGEVAGRDVDLLHAIAAPVASTVRVAQLHDQAKRAAMTDGLTGVLNHRAFYERLDRAVSGLHGDESVHLLIVDVIGLKAINDNYGHLTGDKVLKAVADAFVARLRRHDVVARYGGDEFAAILRGPLDRTLDEIIARIEEPVPCEVEDGFTLNVRLRCGAAQSVDSDTRATELVARADALLYQRIRPSARATID